MAQGKPIQYSDIAKKADIEQLQNDLKELNTAMATFKSNIDTISKAIAKNPLKSGKDLQGYNAAVNDAVTTTDKLGNAQIKAIKTSSDYFKSIQALEKQKERETKAERELNAALNLTVKSEEDLIRKTNALVKVRKQLDQTTKEGQKTHKELTAEINKNTKALKAQDLQIGRSQRNVGNYASALKGVGSQFLGALGLTSLVYGFIGAVKGAFSTITQFGQAQSTLAATLGKTKSEIEDLTKSAIEYGKATKFTATQVSSLQNELAKLGFIASEIKLVTKPVLDLAEATGGDLASAAKVTGIAIRSYGLSALEAREVNAALAISTTKSALSFSDFETVLSTVGPVAKAYGFTLQDTLALTGKLKDAGFDASSASTALRNILLNLADANGALAQKLGGNVTTIEELIPSLIQLKNSGVDLNTTLQLTDKRSVAAFNALLMGSESVIELRDALVGVNDAFDEMIGTKTDNTVAAMDRLGSAWDGVVLSFKESDGFFQSFFDSIATTLNTLTDEFTTTGDKLRILFGFGEMQEQAQKALEYRMNLLSQINDMDSEGLASLRNQWQLAADGGDKFAMEVIKRVEDQQAAILESEKQAQLNLRQAELNAAAAKEELQKQITEREKKESEKRIKIAQEEARQKRILLMAEQNIEDELADDTNDIFDKMADDTVSQLGWEQEKQDAINETVQSEADAANAKIALSEQEAADKERLENAKQDAQANTFTIAKALAGENAEAQKGIAIAETIITTIQSAVKAFNSLADIPIVGPALGAIAAAAAAASGYAQVRKIQNTKIPKYYDGTEYLGLNGNPKGRDTIPIMAHEGERIVPSDINEHLAGVANPELPSLVNLGKMVKEQGFMMMVNQQRMTNNLLSHWTYVDKKGREISLSGNVKAKA